MEDCEDYEESIEEDEEEEDIEDEDIESLNYIRLLTLFFFYLKKRTYSKYLLFSELRRTEDYYFLAED